MLASITYARKWEQTHQVIQLKKTCATYDYCMCFPFKAYPQLTACNS